MRNQNSERQRALSKLNEMNSILICERHRIEEIILGELQVEKFTKKRKKLN